jgi:hypothetical protein
VALSGAITPPIFEFRRLEGNSMTMKTSCVSLALAVALLTFAPKSSWAISDVTLDGNTATGVTDFFVPGVGTYNVTFYKTDANNLYGVSPNPVFQFANLGETQFVMGFLDDILTNAGASSVGTSSNLQDSATVYWVGVEGSTDPFTINALNSVYLPSDRWITQTVESLLYDDIRVYADFQVVPEPGTALLMGLGLAGLSAAGRSRQDDSETTA